MTEEYKPVISFQAYRIEKFNYSKRESSGKTEDNKFQVGVQPGFDEEKKRAIITVNVQFGNKDVDIDIVVNGYFELQDGKTDNFAKYLVINGTAILFPYIRSMISMLTSLDNENAILIPTINTNSLWHDNQE
ncbi:protein-export chaperone SecB [Leuconostoc mesenteroides]|uniref:protein-export chaperone SecB n=1 Tax=Leuconostoc mesenteroides TaxID=1245 RepID=UPI002360799F|nr:protein-export chaperone SecB [Leuconostoc mesenteroides]